MFWKPFFTVFDPHDIERFQKLNELNVTNYRQVVIMRVVVVIFFAAGFAFVREMFIGGDDHHSTALELLQMMFWAAFGFSGLNVAQYTSKRFSDSGYARAKAEGRSTTV